MKNNEPYNPEKGNVPKYLNLLTDFGFKKMFGEQNKKFLIAFLNSILAESVGAIEDVKYMNPGRFVVQDVGYASPSYRRSCGMERSYRV